MSENNSNNNSSERSFNKKNYNKPSSQPTQILPEDKMPVLTMHEISANKLNSHNKFRPKSDFDKNRGFKKNPNNFKPKFNSNKSKVFDNNINEYDDTEDETLDDNLVNEKIDYTKENENNNLNKEVKYSKKSKNINPKVINENTKENVTANELTNQKPDRTLQNLKSNLNNPNFKKNLHKLQKEIEILEENVDIVGVENILKVKSALPLENNKINDEKSNLNNPNYQKKLLVKASQNNSVESTVEKNEIIPNKQIETTAETLPQKVEKVSTFNQNNNSNSNSIIEPISKTYEDKVTISTTKVEQLNNFTISIDKMLSLDQIYKAPYNLYFEQLLNFLKNKLYIDKNAKIVLGVSGGVDSVVMLDMLANLSLIYPLEIHVAHFNHSLRGDEANHDKEYVKKLAEEYNLPFHASTGKVKEFSEKNSLSIEEAARILRYKFFERVATTEKVDFLATAHTADDSVETFLINLFRGSGLTGLSGIPSKREFIKNIFVIRPLINFKKSDLIKYAKLRELRWREDSSNSESIYTRNKIRNTLIPFLEKEYNPNLVNILNRTSRLIQQADKYVIERVKESVDSLILSASESSINLKLPLFQTHSSFIQGEILQLLFEKYFGNTALTNSQIDSILDLINANTGTKINIYQNIFALKDRETIVIFKEKQIEKINQKIKTIGEYEFENFKLNLTEIKKNEIELDDNPLVEYLDFEFMPQFLNIRNWQKGDTFVPFGMAGRVKVSDFLINEKVSTMQKDNICVLDDGLDIIWIIGKRFSEKYKISKDTKKFLKAEVIYK